MEEETGAGGIGREKAALGARVARERAQIALMEIDRAPLGGVLTRDELVVKELVPVRLRGTPGLVAE